MDEVTVAAADSEPIAELIAGRLRAEGIAARVRYESQAGIPRQIAPAGLGFGPGGFRVAVVAQDAERARELLADAQPLERGRSRVFKAVAMFVLIAFVLSFVPSILGLIQALFGR